MKKITSIALWLAAACQLSNLQAAAPAADDWKTNAISPVANPLFFESPLIQSEVRPLYVYHKIANDFVGGYARVYAVQLRYAVNDRLAIIATKDGYIQLRTHVPALNRDGWADIGGGIKYALIDDKANQFILTPGLKYEAATGNQRVFQGNGKGEFNIFVSAEKGWDQFHLTGTFGGRVPVEMSRETASLHYSLQADYYTCQWFIPFFVASGMTVVSEANNGTLGKVTNGVEGYDLINFGSGDAGGRTQIVLGAGFRTRLCSWADLGFAYEKSVTTPRGLFDSRFTVDAIVRF